MKLTSLHGLAMVAALSLAGCGNLKMNQDNPLAGLIKPMVPPKPGEVARDAFNVYDADARRHSVSLISAATWGGEEPYLRMYRLLVDDPDPTVRAACVKALGLHGTTEDAKVMVRRLGDESASVRWEAAKALQRIHSAEATAPLITAMGKDEDGDVRMASAGALGQYPQPAVFNALVGALNDSDFSVCAAAHQSLCTLTGYDFGTDSSMWALWSDRHPGELFKHQKPYVWQPYIAPRGVVQKVQFWKKHSVPQPQTPVGMDEAQKPSS